MYLLDTNVISEMRRGRNADAGVRQFLHDFEDDLFLPVKVIGELRYGVESMRRNSDHPQAKMLELWLNDVLEIYAGRIKSFDLECAQIWGTMSAATHQSAIDKQIAASALVYDRTLGKRNSPHSAGTGTRG